MNAEWKKIAGVILGNIEWESETLGFCNCPGAARHTGKNSPRDCRVTFDQVPTIYCFHSSCESDLAAANHRLRSDIARFDRSLQPVTSQPYVPSTAEIAARQAKAERDHLTKHAQSSLKVILNDYAMDPGDLFEFSPLSLLDDPARDWRLLLTLFEPDDVLWIGNKTSSCNDEADESRKAVCRRFFRTKTEWLKESSAPDQFICPSTFKPGTHSRCNEAVVHRRFLVVESDVLDKVQMCAVFNWLRSFMNLRAVVDTAGKSLHGWFDFPADELLAHLRVILPNLGRESKEPTLDPALFKPAQPVRLPGARRDQKLQSLLFLDIQP